MSEWFYVPGSLEAPSVELSGAEAHHIGRVLRKQAGDQVTLFDGCGTEAVAEITDVRKTSIALRVLDRRRSPEPQPEVHLATAVPKGDRFRWLVEKATELGVARLVPIETSHSVVEPGAGKLDKMRQTVIAACKQSHRARLMAIEPVTTFDHLLPQIHTYSALVAHPGGKPIGTIQEVSDATRPRLLLVGPEGGFTDDEVACASAAGAQPVSLGPQVLRIETAAIALAACTIVCSGWRNERLNGS